VLAGDSEFECEAQITRRDGQRIDCLVAARPFLDRNGHTIGIVESFKDITELKASRAAAIRAEQLAAVGQLSAAVAHEINNPINVIINYGQLLNAPSHPHDVRDLGGRIVEEGERVAAIVETLLSFSRRTSKVKMPVSIAKVVRDTITLVGAQLKKDAITLQTDVPDDLPPVDCIPQEMQRVLLNLIDNARWALNQRYPDWHEDKILEITAAVPSCSVGDTEVLVSVHDHGTGIPKAALDKVMNPFFTTKPTGQGTGLGLSIVHDIVSEIGGHVTIASDEGVSTTIRLRLPTATRAAVEEAR
jgi:signal transduction histidine kinase